MLCILVNTEVSAATLAVKLKGASETLESLGNCSLAFYRQQQAIHSLKLNPQQPRWFGLSVNSLHIGESRLPIMLCFFSNPNCTAFSSSISQSRELTGFSPRIRRIFSSGNIRSNPGKFRLLGPYDITIGRVTRLEDVSVTDSNLKNAAVQLGCKLATHCSVFVQLVTGEIASVQSS